MARAVAALANGDAEALAPLLFNALEESAVSLVPQIRRLGDALLALGALGARMTGSGSAVFGLFSSGEAASRAAAAMETHADCAFAAAARSV